MTVKSRLIFTFFAAVAVYGSVSATFFGDVVARANSYYLEIAAGAPFIETWTDTSRLNIENDWNSVVAIEGYSGAGLAPTAGTDPRTILADNAPGTLDVTANQTNPITSTADGVAEFQIANPTIALRGSDGSSAPNIVIHINTSAGCVGKAISVSYDIRDIDGSRANAVSQVNTQYRVGGSGPYTNLNFGYTPDASTGPNQATAVTQKVMNLPLSATGQPQIDIRIMTTNALGADEWLGIDNIKVDCVPSTSASGMIQGRVLDANGNGISKATVTLYNPVTEQMETAITNGFGHYRFEGLMVGFVYVAFVQSKRHHFSSGPQTVQLLDDEANGVDFIAD